MSCAPRGRYIRVWIVFFELDERKFVLVPPYRQGLAQGIFHVGLIFQVEPPRWIYGTDNDLAKSHGAVKAECRNFRVLMQN